MLGCPKLSSKYFLSDITYEELTHSNNIFSHHIFLLSDITYEELTQSIQSSTVYFSVNGRTLPMRN